MIEREAGEFICIAGERIGEGVSFQGHTVTLKLTPHSAKRLGQETIEVAATAILENCELPTAPEAEEMKPHQKSVQQVDLFGNAISAKNPDQFELLL